jgi:AcrR family transcriptional regulator
MTRNRSKRLPNETRRAEILESAISLFSSKGISVTTRDIAKASGITQPLIFRHFKGKEDLVDAIYLEHFEGMFDQSWRAKLRDRSRSLYQRLTEFYLSYTEVVFQENWMRIYFWSAMSGADINNRYTRFVIEHIVTPIAMEVRAEVNPDADGETELSDLEFETVYTAHSGILYYGLRKFIFRDAPAIDRSQIIYECVASMLQGAPTVVENYMERNRVPAPAS